MSFGKERNKLEELSRLVSVVEVYNEENLEVLNEGYLEYSKLIKVLYKKQPNVFANLHKYELGEIKANKKFTKESFSDHARQENFIAYRDSIMNAVERTVEYIHEYL